MSQLHIRKDQIQKIALSLVGFVFLLYVYFNFFLGPLNRSRNTMLTSMKEKQSKLDSSKSEMSKAASLEQQAKTATTRFAAFKALNPEGAPIAWFPPRIKVFFTNEQIDKAVMVFTEQASYYTGLRADSRCVIGSEQSNWRPGVPRPPALRAP